MSTTENAVINFSVIVMWFSGFPIVSAKPSSEIYCGGNCVLGFHISFL